MERRGFIFACTNKSEKEILKRLIFATNRAYGHKIFAIRQGDYLFLYNLDTDELHGVFVADGEGFYEENSSLFDGKYPFQIKVKIDGKLLSLKKASLIFKKLSLNWRDILSEHGARVLYNLLTGKNINLNKVKKDKLVDTNYRPPLFSTTLWDYPRQSMVILQREITNTLASPLRS